jgi:hypothetical protein
MNDAGAVHGLLAEDDAPAAVSEMPIEDRLSLESMGSAARIDDALQGDVVGHAAVSEHRLRADVTMRRLPSESTSADGCLHMASARFYARVAFLRTERVLQRAVHGQIPSVRSAPSAAQILPYISVPSAAKYLRALRAIRGLIHFPYVRLRGFHDKIAAP